MIRLTSFSIAIAFLLAVPLAHADKIAQYKKPQSFKVSDDFYKIEGAGLYQGADARSLGAKMWDNSDRAEITKHLITLPVNSQSPVVQRMIKAVLLSETNIKKLDDHNEINIGEDLLTVRMLKLMQGGYYKEAMELYSVAIESPHHQDIAKAGILAMLGNGEKSIACLEMKTLGNMNMGDPFWPAFMGYCNYTLAKSPSESAQNLLKDTKYEIMRVMAFNKEFIFPYTPESFSKLSLLEKNTLVAEGRIESPDINDTTIDDIPARDIYALLSLETLNDKARLLLTLKAVEWGIQPMKHLAEIYKDLKDEAALLGGLPHLYNQINHTEDNVQKSALLREALSKRETQGNTALLPFAAFIAEGALAETTPEEMLGILPILYQAHRTVSVETLEDYLSQSERHEENAQYFQSLKLISTLNNTPDSHKISETIQNLGIFHKNPQTEGAFVIENLDNNGPDVDNADKVYEKDVDAALQKEHTNASEALQKLLIRRSRANALGETVLLSIELLHKRPIREIEQKLFEDSSRALEDVNLKEFSQKMAIERLIGDEENI